MPLPNELSCPEKRSVVNAFVVLPVPKYLETTLSRSVPGTSFNVSVTYIGRFAEKFFIPVLKLRSMFI